MFSSALKSFGSNISASYEIGKQPVTTSGPWRIFDGKKKTTGSEASVFVFDRKSLEVQSSGFGVRSSATSLRKAQDEVVERLRKEASALARLRHPSILQLMEPVEDTRTGGLMFATEPVTASLAGLLAEKDGQERAGVIGGRPSRFVVEDPDGSLRRRDVEMDELEIQKGLLQVSKGLEFLHESAVLVHGNLTPDAVYVNAKSDWKLSGLSFAGPPTGVEGHQPVPQISLAEVMFHDPRLPRFVQLNLDYTSPDFVLDQNVNTSADMFSLGLLIVALYNSPHVSPIQANGNQSNYKRSFSSASTIPSAGNNFLSARPLPRELKQTLPRLLARRPAERLSAREFQQSAYFDNLLVNTIRYIDDLPAKTTSEKIQFMRGLGRVMPQFPASVLGRKILSALLDEMKDRELLAVVLRNIFQIVKTIPSGRRSFCEQVLPRLREVFLTKTKTEQRDAGSDAGLVAVLENVKLISDSCSEKEFKDDVLPIIVIGLESTHSIADASLVCIPKVLPVLDFSTIKHDLFPVVANVFSKTTSLSIKVRGLETLKVLCGGQANVDGPAEDDLTGLPPINLPANTTLVSTLDKFTIQEKVVPLLKGIKTKEPAVMVAALNVFREVGTKADADFLATDVLPTLWSFSLGPLLDLSQFESFMSLIKTLSSRIEREHKKKLQELASSNRPSISEALDLGLNGVVGNTSSADADIDFERLVLGNKTKGNVHLGANTAGGNAAQVASQQPPMFSWSSVHTASGGLASLPALQPQQPVSRSITPDVSMAAFPALQPSTSTTSSAWTASPAVRPNSSSMSNSSSGPLQTLNALRNTAQSTSRTQQPLRSTTAFALPPPPSSNVGNYPSITLPSAPQTSPRAATGLDKYQSLL